MMKVPSAEIQDSHELRHGALLTMIADLPEPPDTAVVLLRVPLRSTASPFDLSSSNSPIRKRLLLDFCR
jgi:hypothetical protein